MVATEAERLAVVETSFKDHVIACEKGHKQNCIEHKEMTNKLGSIYRNSLLSLASFITILITFIVNHLAQ